MQTNRCHKGCCNFTVLPYKHGYHAYNKNVNPEQKLRKAGSFIYDKQKNKVLLVQSRGQMWGPPKGSIKENEEVIDCAIREVKEETGLDIEEKNFLGSIIIKTKAQYYFTDMSETDVVLQTHIEDNDANGIGWFDVDCMNSLINDGLISINQHCRMLIKKVFDKDIVFNIEPFVSQ